MKSTGERIKTLLKEEKMTQKQLAELSGVTESALSHYIKGESI
jgi:transcriptional regulator with XRE-family HTH domain